MKRTDIQEKLLLAKSKSKNTPINLDEIQAILLENQIQRNEIQLNISKNSKVKTNNLNIDLLTTENIFHIDQIKNICVIYRLRFLNSSYFKGPLPAEAISKIRSLEKEHLTTLNGFKILAPSKLFKLKDKDDPILFAPIGNGYFYLIHKWGNDLHPLRRMMMWPLKNVINLIWFIVLVSFILTICIPTGLFSKTSTLAQSGLLFFFTFKSMVAIIVFYAFAKGKNFSTEIWNSKYINT